MKFTNAITIDRSTADVFAYLADLEHLPQWNYALESTTKTSEGPVGVGSRYRQIRTIPTRSEESLEVTAYEPDSKLSLQGDLGPFQSDVDYLLVPDGDGTLLTNTMHLQPSGAVRLIAPLAAFKVKAAVAANLEALKQLLEQR